MTMPNFRAWKHTESPEMFNDIDFIDFNKQVVGINYHNPSYRLDEEPLNNVILMQCTGLKDKNGVEIYEGDIVKFEARSHYHPEVYAWEYETKGVGIIRYETGGYVLGGREEILILESLFGMFMNYEEIETEVIGNIYENPELLEEEE